jgi:hypothetical protein
MGFKFDQHFKTKHWMGIQIECIPEEHGDVDIAGRCGTPFGL